MNIIPIFQFLIMQNDKLSLSGNSKCEKVKKHKPQKLDNIWDLDTGAGHTGRLTILDINSNPTGNQTSYLN